MAAISNVPHDLTEAATIGRRERAGQVSGTSSCAIFPRHSVRDDFVAHQLLQGVRRSTCSRRLPTRALLLQHFMNNTFRSLTTRSSPRPPSSWRWSWLESSASVLGGEPLWKGCGGMKRRLASRIVFALFACVFAALFLTPTVLTIANSFMSATEINATTAYLRQRDHTGSKTYISERLNLKRACRIWSLQPVRDGCGQ